MTSNADIDPALREAIERTVAQIEAEGGRPTARSVRLKIGRKMDVVNSALRRVLSEKKSATAEQFEPSAAIRAALERNLIELVGESNRFAQDRIAAVEQTASARVAEAEADADAAMEGEEAFRRQVDELTRQVQAGQEFIATLQRETTALQAQLAERRQQVEDLKQILSAVERQRPPRRGGSAK